MILKFKEMGINNFHLLGGEPLCSNNIADIILFFKNNDVYYSLNTNGTNLMKILLIYLILQILPIYL